MSYCPRHTNVRLDASGDCPRCEALIERHEAAGEWEPEEGPSLAERMYERDIARRLR